MEDRLPRLLRILRAADKLDVCKLAVFQISKLATSENLGRLWQKLLVYARDSSWNVRQLVALTVQLTASLLPSDIVSGSDKVSDINVNAILSQDPLLAQAPEQPDSGDTPTKKAKLVTNEVSVLIQGLQIDLLDTRWHVRQGAAMCLKAIVPHITSHSWLEGLMCTCFEALIRDQLIDYAADNPLYPTRSVFEEILVQAMQVVGETAMIEKLFAALAGGRSDSALLVLRHFALDASYIDSIAHLLDKGEDVMTLAAETLTHFPSLGPDIQIQLVTAIGKCDDISPCVIWLLKSLRNCSSESAQLPLPMLYKFLVHSSMETRQETLEIILTYMIEVDEELFCLLLQGAVMETEKAMIAQYIKALTRMLEIDSSATQNLLLSSLEQWIDFVIQENPRDLSFFRLPVTDSLDADVVYAFVDSRNDEDIKLNQWYERKMFSRMFTLAKVIRALDIPLQEPACPYTAIIWMLVKKHTEPKLIHDFLIGYDTRDQLVLSRVRAIATYCLVSQAKAANACLPEKLTPLYQALVSSYRSDCAEAIKHKASRAAADLTLLTLNRVPNFNNRFLTNILSTSDYSPIVGDLVHCHGLAVFDRFEMFGALMTAPITEVGQLLLLQKTVEAASEDEGFVSCLLDLFPKLLETPETLQTQCNACIEAFAKRFTGQVLAQMPVGYETEDMDSAIINALMITFSEGQASCCAMFAAAFVIPVLRASMICQPSVAEQLHKLLGVLLKFISLDDFTDTGFSDIETRKSQGIGFVNQLSMYHVEPYVPRIRLKVKLRPYQNDGVSWLRFLYRYNLGGMLCDDMGLGKTVQTLCAIAEAHTEKPDSVSLIVVPPTLQIYWCQEATQYFESVNLQLMPKELRKPLSPGIYVTKYDLVKRNIDSLSSQVLLYCILDEGHVIRNSKTKLSAAIGRIRARNRLILSGTPLQNSILDIWNLFNFVMPGLLGAEKDFAKQYRAPLAPKHHISAFERKEVVFKDETVALQLLSQLHKIALPFILRRMKSEVCAELPPKIMTDYPVKISAMQKQIQQAYVKQGAMKDITFETKLLNHPYLVAPGPEPGQVAISGVGVFPYSLSDVPKLTALRDILVNNEIATSAGANHKALIFSKWKATLDLIISDVLAPLFPCSQYMQLDGSIPENQRVPISNRFNRDEKIRVLLSTTEVGGMGLTLTGADVVIMFDHNFNPVKDLQAIDRAHRIGQKRPLNVFRLITTDTMEETILGLQNHKWKIANEIINSTNADKGEIDTASIAQQLAQEVDSMPNEEEWQLS